MQEEKGFIIKVFQKFLNKIYPDIIKQQLTLVRRQQFVM